MSPQTSLSLYKNIVKRRARIDYMIERNDFFDLAFEVRSITRSLSTLRLRAEMLYEKSAICQMKKLAKLIP